LKENRELQQASNTVDLHVDVVAGSYILKGGPVDEAQMLLDDHLVKVQAMMASPFSKPFEAELIPWERKLTRLQDILDNCTIMFAVMQDACSAASLGCSMGKHWLLHVQG
jgi:hypothetical protein